MNGTEYDSYMWRKPTNTGLQLNFPSICPTTWNSGLIMCFLPSANYVIITLCKSKKLKNYECYFKKMQTPIGLSTK